MPKRFLLIGFLFFFLFTAFTKPVRAAFDPLSVPNNKFGIHILFPDELTDAVKLVNTNGGDWGYVVIPIQSGDKDLDKWQKFMDTCKTLHIIPIIRLATEGDYFNTKVWRKPVPSDVLDFANFLNSLNWPTTNRYVVVYNETNRGDEWGGTPDPSEYAQILSYAVSVFKSRSQDFFMISAGFDNASIDGNDAMNEYHYMSQMNDAVPGIYNQVDGIASHSYPNPGFSSPPTAKGRESIAGFLYEETFLQNLTGRQIPVFITETGWSNTAIPSSVIAQYYQTAFDSVWNDGRIVTVAPFLLRAGGGPFQEFSFLDANGKAADYYTAVAAMQKPKGQPPLTTAVLASTTRTSSQNSTHIPEKAFAAKSTGSEMQFAKSDVFKNMLKWLFLF